MRNLVLDLLQVQLGLTIFEFRAHLQSLRGTVAKRNIQTQAPPLYLARRIDQLVKVVP